MLVNFFQHSTDHHWQFDTPAVCTPELISSIKTQMLFGLLFQFKNSVLVY